MSPEAILQACSAFACWRQEGSRHGSGSLRFFSAADDLLLDLPLQKNNGLYYCPLTSVTGLFDPTKQAPSPSVINSVLVGQQIETLQISATTRSQTRQKQSNHTSPSPGPTSHDREHPLPSIPEHANVPNPDPLPRLPIPQDSTSTSGRHRFSSGLRSRSYRRTLICETPRTKYVEKAY